MAYPYLSIVLSFTASKNIVKHRLHVCTKDRVKATINGQESDVLLPNVRRISRNIHQLPEGQELLSDTTSHMLMQMGQFVDHDLVLSPELGHLIHTVIPFCEILETLGNLSDEGKNFMQS